MITLIYELYCNFHNKKLPIREGSLKASINYKENSKILEPSHVLNKQDYLDSHEWIYIEVIWIYKKCILFPFPIFKSQSETKHKTCHTKNSKKNKAFENGQQCKMWFPDTAKLAAAILHVFCLYTTENFSAYSSAPLLYGLANTMARLM